MEHARRSGDVGTGLTQIETLVINLIASQGMAPKGSDKRSPKPKSENDMRKKAEINMRARAALRTDSIGAKFEDLVTSYVKVWTGSNEIDSELNASKQLRDFRRELVMLLLPDELAVTVHSALAIIGDPTDGLSLAQQAENIEAFVTSVGGEGTVAAHRQAWNELPHGSRALAAGQKVGWVDPRSVYVPGNLNRYNLSQTT